MYEVRFDDGEVFAETSSLEEAEEIRNDNNFNFMSRSLHIYEIFFDKNEYNDKKIV